MIIKQIRDYKLKLVNKSKLSNLIRILLTLM